MNRDLLAHRLAAQHAPLEAPKKYLDRFPQITDEKRKLFAAMMAAMDDAIGRVFDKLRELKLEERTLVFFLSDNGGPTRELTSSNAPLRGEKGQLFEGGIRVPAIARWPGKVPAGASSDFAWAFWDFLPTAAELAVSAR